jgi:transketolase
MEKNFKIISSEIRLQFLKLILDKNKYHLGGSASCLDLLTVLFFGKYINLKKKNRSPFILSKGHALGVFYSILLKQRIISIKKFNLLKKKALLGGQLDTFNLAKHVDWNTGSLGHSIGVCIGFAIANPKKKVWTIVGDAEIDEGSVWEALFFISEKKIDNIIIIIDRNRLSASSYIEKKEVLDNNILNQLRFSVTKINGHDHQSIAKCYDQAIKSKKSSIIIANTIKGKGFGIAENNIKYSHEAIKNSEISELIKYYEQT